MGAGVRELGRGNTGTALLDAAPAAYWNPALLPFGRRTEVGLGGEVRALDRNGGFLSLQGRATGNLGLGLGVVNRGDFSVRAYDADENPMGTARPQNFASYLGLGLRTSRRNAFGATVQWYSSNLDVQGGYGNISFVGGLNLGWFHRFGDSLSVAAVIRNLGLNSDLSADFDQTVLGDQSAPGFERSATDFFPKTLILAAEWRHSYWNRPFAFAAEALDYQLKRDLYAADANFHRQAFRLGMECEVAERAHLRAGLDRGDITFGLGYAYPWGRRLLRFDYALVLESGWTTFNPFAVGLSFPL